MIWDRDRVTQNAQLKACNTWQWRKIAQSTNRKSKHVYMNPTISIIILNVNDLNTSIKRYRLPEYKNQNIKLPEY